MNFEKDESNQKIYRNMLYSNVSATGPYKIIYYDCPCQKIAEEFLQ